MISHFCVTEPESDEVRQFCSRVKQSQKFDIPNQTASRIPTLLSGDTLVSRFVFGKLTMHGLEVYAKKYK